MLLVRTTLTLDDDLASRLKDIAHERGVPFKQVVNEAIRTGLDRTPERKRFVQKTYDMGEPLVDLTKAGQLADAMYDEWFVRKFLGDQ